MGVPAGIEPSAIELGRIKIGGLGAARTAKSGRPYRVPEKRDYFTITTHERTPAGDLVEDTEAMDLLRAGGFASPDGRIRRIPVVLLSDDPDDVLDAVYAAYDGKRRIATCNGVTRTRYWRGAVRLEEPEVSSCRGEHVEAPWKLHTIFRCCLATGAARFGGFYSFRTTSVISTRQLWGGLAAAKRMLSEILSGPPFQLVVRPLQVSPGGKATTIYVVHLELRAKDLADVQRMALTAARYRADNAREIDAARRAYAVQLLPPASEYEPDEEQEAVQAEFCPEPEPDDDQQSEDPIGAEAALAWVNRALAADWTMEQIEAALADLGRAAPEDLTEREAEQLLEGVVRA